jgi:hypothetical protein
MTGVASPSPAWERGGGWLVALSMRRPTNSPKGNWNLEGIMLFQVEATPLLAVALSWAAFIMKRSPPEAK